MLVRSLRSLWYLWVHRLGGLCRVRSRILVVHEVSGRCIGCGVRLLLSILGVYLLSLRGEDRVWEGGRSGWIVSSLLRELSIVQVEIETVVVGGVLHLGPIHVSINLGFEFEIGTVQSCRN